jgi:HKD family nuclease
MKVEVLTQGPATSSTGSVQSLLASQIGNGQLDIARVATAYATVSGVRALLDAFEEHGLTSSRWLLGLDDAVTQPGAIDLLMSLENAEVRVATCEDRGFRFHPKFFVFGKRENSKKLLAIIGSANLTASAFWGNAEAVAILESQSDGDRSMLNSAWSALWAQGHAPSQAELESYQDKYVKGRVLRRAYKRIAQKPEPEKQQQVLESDDAELDPSMANICWIECGNVTAMGRELEFKAEQGLFFGLSPWGGKSKAIALKVSDGTVVELLMKYQGNHMWRLQMNNNVPEVKAGLRPIEKNGKLGRSPYVAVFTRGAKGQPISLDFVDLNGREFAKLRKRTVETGTLGQTTAREYGWC